MADQAPTTGDPQPGGFDAAPSQGETGGNELHEQFVSSVPENLRDAARELVPHWDKYVQPKFQENATYRKQWEPYETLGLNEIQPDQVQQALGIFNAINDPEQLPDLYEQLGAYMESQGLLQGGEEDDDLGLDGDGEYGDLPPAVMQQMQSMQQQLQQATGFIQQFQQQQAQAQAEQFVNSQLEALKAEHKNLGQEDMDTICTFALKYDGQDAIQRGFADYQALMSRAEQSVFQNKSEAPAPANSGGTAATKPQAVTSFEDAAAAARERLLQSRQ